MERHGVSRRRLAFYVTGRGYTRSCWAGDVPTERPMAELAVNMPRGWLRTGMTRGEFAILVGRNVQWVAS